MTTSDFDPQTMREIAYSQTTDYTDDQRKAAWDELPQYLKAFGDFDHAPELPAGFEDVSYHNDSCPSFIFEATQKTFYLNYRNPELREFEAACFVLDDNQRTLYTGDDTAEALRIAMAPAP